MKGVDAIARILKKEDMDFIGCIPYNTLEEAAAKAGVRPMLFRQERVGINTADGFSRVTNGRRIGVFTMQAGPGAENGFPGVAQAYSDSTPILLLPAGANRDRSGIRPTFSPARSYRDVTKWADTINMPNRIDRLPRYKRYDVLDGMTVHGLIVLLGHVTQVGRDHRILQPPQGVVERQRLTVKDV